MAYSNATKSPRACAITLALSSFLGLILITSSQEIPSIPQPDPKPQQAAIYKAPDQSSSGSASGLGFDRNRFVPFLPQVRVQNDGTADNKVGVHIPMIFDMVGGGKNQSRLDLSVLSGLVTVNKDKQRNPLTGEIGGPLTVTVFGIPVYSGRTIQPTRPRSENLDESILARQAAMTGRVRSASDSIQDTVVDANERVINTLSSLVDRITSLIRRPKDQI